MDRKNWFERYDLAAISVGAQQFTELPDIGTDIKNGVDLAIYNEIHNIPVKACPAELEPEPP